MAETLNVSQSGNSTQYTYSPTSSGTVAVPDNVIVKANPSSASGFSQTYGSDAFSNGLASSAGLTSGLNDIYNMINYNNAVARANAYDQREWNRKMMYEAYFLNAAEAATNRNWQQYMSNTAHQREVQDLLAAGLNPVLSAGGGNGAAVGSGSQASVSSPSSNAAQTDMSGTSAIMSMLGSLISANTQMATASLNAQNQMAIADKNIASAQLIAELNAQTNKYTSKYSSDNALAASYAAAAAMLQAANINAATSKDIAMLQSMTNRYGVDKSFISSTEDRKLREHDNYWNRVYGLFSSAFGNMRY